MLRRKKGLKTWDNGSGLHVISKESEQNMGIRSLMKSEGFSYSKIQMDFAIDEMQHLL